MADAPDLIVVTGPPGAGKTTVARALSRRFNPSALVAGDQFLAFIDQGHIAPWTAATEYEPNRPRSPSAHANPGGAGRFAGDGPA